MLDFDVGREPALGILSRPMAHRFMTLEHLEASAEVIVHDLSYTGLRHVWMREHL